MRAKRLVRQLALDRAYVDELLEPVDDTQRNRVNR